MMHPDLERALLNTMQNPINNILTARRQILADNNSPEYKQEQAFILHLMDLVIKNKMYCSIPTIIDMIGRDSRCLPFLRAFKQQYPDLNGGSVVTNWFMLNYIFLPNCARFNQGSATVFRSYKNNTLPLLSITPAMSKEFKRTTQYWGTQYVDDSEGPEPVPVSTSIGRLQRYGADDDESEESDGEIASGLPTTTTTSSSSMSSSSSSSAVGTSSSEAAAAAQPFQ